LLDRFQVSFAEQMAFLKSSWGYLLEMIKIIPCKLLLLASLPGYLEKKRSTLGGYFQLNLQK